MLGSPPTRRRGSKLGAPVGWDAASDGRLPHGGVDRNDGDRAGGAAALRSPPTRRRGSKHELAGFARAKIRSPPTRRRGSKQIAAALGHSEAGRLPHGGVDRNYLSREWRGLVRGRLPHGGVDRNAPSSRGKGNLGESPPTRRRGSKPELRRRLFEVDSRLPHGGVDRNHPGMEFEDFVDRRLPHGGVDRNLSPEALSLCQAVASHTEAWIETPTTVRPAWLRPVASHTEAWIETCSNRAPSGTLSVASHTEAWIETRWISDGQASARGRLPHGGVDRNIAGLVHATGLNVASHTEAWIETWPGGSPRARTWSPPTRRRGSKQVL